MLRFAGASQHKESTDSLNVVLLPPYNGSKVSTEPHQLQHVHCAIYKENTPL